MILHPLSSVCDGLGKVACLATAALSTSTNHINSIGGVASSLPSILSSSSSSLSTTTTTATAVSTILLRGGGGGGAAASAALNLSREGYLIQEMASFGTLTALVMNAALRLWTSTKFGKEQSQVVPKHVFTISTALCVMSGAFTAILFQMLGIYSKSALGMVNDDGYKAFSAATAIYRKWGFRCFLTELSTFVLSFLLSVYQKLWTEAKNDDHGKDSQKIQLWQRPGTYIMAGCICLVLLGTYQIKQVLNLATQHIFVEAYHHKFA